MKTSCCVGLRLRIYTRSIYIKKVLFKIHLNLLRGTAYRNYILTPRVGSLPDNKNPTRRKCNHPNLNSQKKPEKTPTPREKMEEIMKSLLYYTPQSPNPITPPPPHPPFTESELSAAEQLLHLSESSGTGAGASGCHSTASASSSTLSVNAPLNGLTEEDEGLWRRNKRYRPIADVYASTLQLGPEGGGKKKERKRRKRMTEGDSC